MSLIGQKEPEWAGTAYHKGEQKKLSSKDFAGGGIGRLESRLERVRSG